MKKIIILLVVIICVAALIFVAYNSLKETKVEETQNTEFSNETPVENEEVVYEDEEEEFDYNNKPAIVYFSATGNTRTVAEYIKEQTHGDIFEIVPKEIYTMDDLRYTSDDARATKEQNDKDARPEIANEIDLSDYDLVFLGYPIWFSDVPRIIQTFVETNALDGKDVIPFCTSGSSGIAGSLDTLHEYTDVNWIGGKRLEVSEGQVEVWMEGLKGEGILFVNEEEPAVVLEEVTSGE